MTRFEGIDLEYVSKLSVLFVDVWVTRRGRTDLWKLSRNETFRVESLRFGQALDLGDLDVGEFGLDGVVDWEGRDGEAVLVSER